MGVGEGGVQPVTHCNLRKVMARTERARTLGLMSRPERTSTLAAGLVLSEDYKAASRERMIKGSSVNMLVLSLNAPTAAQLSRRSKERAVPFFMHRLACFGFTWMPIMLLVLQVALFVVIADATYQNAKDRDTFCDLHLEMRAVAGLCVAMVYLLRFLQNSIDDYGEAFDAYLQVSIKCAPRQVRYMKCAGNFLPGSNFDAAFSSCFNLGTAFLNIALIYVTDDTVDVLVNSLAIQFIAALDDEFLRMALERHPIITEHLIRQDFIHREALSETDSNVYIKNNNASCNDRDIMIWCCAFPIFLMIGVVAFLPLCM